MSFTITFYNNTDERIKVTKSLPTGSSLTGTLREGCSVTSPSILIEKSDTEVMPTYNYAYIDEFNRYYFIDDIISENTHLWRINMSVDVLMSYATGIRALTAMVTRSEYSGIYDLSQENKIMFTDYDKEVTETPVYGTSSFNASGDVSYYALTYYTSNSDNLLYDRANPVLPSRPTSLFSNVNTTKLGNIASAHTTLIENTDDITTTTWRAGGLPVLAHAVAIDSNLASYIASCIAFPFDLEKLQVSGDDYIYQLYFGDTAVDWKVGTIDTYVRGYEPKYQGCPVINIADFTITADEGSFLDYEPYTQYELYLPYKGWITLPADQVVGKRIRVDYTCELTSVTGLVQVYTLEGSSSTSYASSKLIYESDCQLGVNIPFSVTDNQERTANIATSAVSSAVGMVATALIAML